jgi:glutamine cyclotransferase
MTVRRAADPGAVLNGIAWDAATGRFYVTGKLWSEILEVEIGR